MKENSVWEHYGYAYMMDASLLAVLASLFNQFAGLKLWEPWVVFLALAVAAISMSLCRYWKQTVFTMAVIFCVGLLWLAMIRILWVGPVYTGPEFLADFVERAQEAGWNRAVFEWTRQIFSGPNMKMILLVLFTGVLLFITQSNFIGRGILAVAVFAWLVFGSLLYWHIPKSAAVAGMLYVFMLLVEAVFCRPLSRKPRDVDTRSIAWLAPVFFIAVMLFMFLPAKDTPIQWTLIRKSWQAVRNVGESVQAQMYARMHADGLNFAVRFTGYSENAQLGGNLKASDDQALVVEFSHTSPRSLYLSGTVKNVYTGYGWENELAKEERPYSERKLDLAEFLYAMERNETMAAEEGLAASRSLKVIYDGIYTKSMFSPGKAGTVKVDGGRAYEESQDETTFRKLPRRGVGYEISYLEPNYASTYMEDFLREQEGYQYDPKRDQGENYSEFYSHVREEYPGMNLADIKDLETVLAARANRIREEYTSLPEGYSQRVIELAQTLTEGISSDYEKMKVIEAFLSRYEYTLTPGTPPDGGDVVEYFLFDSRAGYCTYFSSAMAVMGRAVGVPTRYVQGYMVPVSNQEEETSKTVLDSNSHAWVEAYIQGVGWIPFEPSAGFSSYRYRPWKVEKKAAANGEIGGFVGGVSGGTYTPRYFNADDWEEQEERERMESELWDRLESVNNAFPEEEEVPEEEPVQKPVVWVPYFLSVLAAVLTVLSLLLLWRVDRRVREYRRAETREKIWQDMDCLFAIWSIVGQPIVAGETFLDYAGRLSRIFPTEKKRITEAAAIYMDVRYSQKEPTELEQKAVEDLRRSWMIHLKNQRAWGRYLRAWCKVYLGVHKRMADG